MKPITSREIQNFVTHLHRLGKSDLTVQKYERDARFFCAYLSGRCVTREALEEYREMLCQTYAPGSVNSMLSSVNRLLSFLECRHRLRLVKIQRSPFLGKEKELTRAEYERLLAAAKGNDRLYYLLQTLCGTGIRVSELPFITVEALKEKKAVISMKGKTRVVLLGTKLCHMLQAFAKRQGIRTGSLFVTRSGKPLDRSNIHHAMKRLCKKAGVEEGKVFPHNLRHLFARVFYRAQKDIVRLADILGHSSINTTRIYTMETGEEHRRMIENLGLVFG